MGKELITHLEINSCLSARDDDHVVIFIFMQINYGTLPLKKESIQNIVSHWWGNQSHGKWATSSGELYGYPSGKDTDILKQVQMRATNMIRG